MSSSSKKPPKKRLPVVSARALERVARAIEDPRIGGLVGSALRAIGKRAPARAEAFPAAPPRPGRGAPHAGTHDTAAMLAELGRGDANEGPTIMGYARAYLARRTTPVDVAELFLRGVEESEREPMRFFISLDAADVRAQAAASAARHARGEALSVLDGVPVAVKDEIDQRGHATTLGTRMAGRSIAAADCLAVARLRALGAVLVGKTNMHELGAGPTGENAGWGTCRNPWNPAHFPGGSSSGSAAVTAAGLVPLAIGCDGGGSIRIPASFCGVVGLKPTFGRVPKVGETPPIAHSITHVGPIGRTVRDAAIGYAALAGRHDDDVDTHAQPAPDALELDEVSLRGLTLGLVEEWFRDAAPDIARACDRARSSLEERGARIVGVELEGLDEVRDTLLATVGAELEHNDWLHDRAQRSLLSADVRIGLALARHMPRALYFRAQRARARIAAGVFQRLVAIDALLSPTTLETAPMIPAGHGGADLDQTMRILRTTALANLTGQPAISFPVGFDARGLPIGMQAIGRPWEEALLLRIAAAESESRVPQRYWPTL